METTFRGQCAAAFPLGYLRIPWPPEAQRGSCSEHVQTKEAVTIATIELCGKALL